MDDLNSELLGNKLLSSSRNGFYETGCFIEDDEIYH